jgi:MFS family permease
VSVSSIADISYLSEVAPARIRGAMVNANELAIALGILLSYCVGYILRDIAGTGCHKIHGVLTSTTFCVEERSC